MRADRRRRCGGAARRGIALPLVLVVLLTVSMFAALLLDASLQAVRAASARTAAMRAHAAVETAVAAMVGASVDSVWGQNPSPIGVAAAWVGRGDSVGVSVVPLGDSLFRFSAQSRSVEGQARARGGAVTFLRLEPDTAAIAARRGRLRPISGWWWSPLQ